MNEVFDSHIQSKWLALESNLTSNSPILGLDIYLLVLSTLLLPQKIQAQELNQFCLSLMSDILYSNQPMSYLHSLFSISTRFNLTPPIWNYKPEHQLILFQRMLSLQNNTSNNHKDFKNYFLPINLVFQIFPTLSQSSQILLLLTVHGLSIEFLTFYPHENQFYQDFFRLCVHGLMLNSSSTILPSIIASSSSSSSSPPTNTTTKATISLNSELIYSELRLRSLLCAYQLISLTSHSPSEITTLLSPHLSTLVPILLQVSFHLSPFFNISF